MAIENLKKHQGILSNTGVRVAVVFRKLPNDDKSCLIVETERLPDSYHDYVIQTLNSREASETNDFYEVLNRRTFPDGTNCLTSLHQRGMLRKEPVTNITMIPLAGQKVPLELINAHIDGKVAEYKARQEVNIDQVVEDAVIKVANKTSGDMQNSALIARGLIKQAELLESDATAKRNEAYALAPELRPGVGRPALSEDIKAEKLEERKEKRRERDRARAATAKLNKVEAQIESSIESKAIRDAARLGQPPVKFSTKSPK